MFNIYLSQIIIKNLPVVERQQNSSRVSSGNKNGITIVKSGKVTFNYQASLFISRVCTYLLGIFLLSFRRS